MGTTKQAHKSIDSVCRDTRSLTNLREAEDTEMVHILSDLGTLVSTNFGSISEAADAYLAFVMRVVGVRTATLTKLDSRFMYVINARDDGGCGITPNGATPIEETFCQYVRASGTLVVVTDAARDARVMRVATRMAFNIGSYLGVPLIFRDGTIHGTLCALDPRPREFSQTEIAIVRIVARHLALLIEGTPATQAERDDGFEGADIPEVAPSTLNEQITLLETVAHDMRNPLSGIQSYVDLFLSDLLGPVSEDQRGVLMQMARATRFINRLINDLIDAATDAGALAILSDSFDPCLLGESVIESFQEQAVACNLSLSMQSDPHLPMIVGDADRLRQILSNFVGNALRYTSEGQVTLHITTEDDTIQFAVEDTGPGIPQEAQSSIWNMHKRLSAKGPGLGLGLYIVQRLAQAMQGTVGVESIPDQGSTFWVRLPVQGVSPRKFKWGAT